MLILWKVPGPGGAPEAMQAWLYQRVFASWAGPLNGSLLYAVAYVLLWLAVLGVLYRRRLFVSV